MDGQTIMKHLNSNGRDKMSFTYLFYENVMLRRSCGVCPFTNLRRPSDITIADFWGWEKTDPLINIDDKGVSLVLINTEKGKEVFDAIKDKLYFIEADLENCLQPNLMRPTEPSTKRMEFEEDYVKYGFDYTFEKYCRIPLHVRITDAYHKLRKLIVPIVKWIIRRR